MIATILCDFDGTVTVQDTGHVILNHFTGDRWIPINDAWRRFEVTTKQRAQQQWSMIQATPETLGAVVDTVTFDPHFDELVAFCRERDYRLHIVSDGFDWYIARLLARHGHPDIPFTANHLRFEDGQLTLSFRHQHPTCRMSGNCKLMIAREMRRDGPVIYVGDGYSDRGGALMADRVMAKGRLLTYCRQHGIPHRQFADFAEVLRIVQAGVEQIPPNPRREMERCP